MKQGWTYKKLGEVTTTINGLWTGKKPPFINVAVIRNTNFTKDCKLDMTNVAYLDVEQKQYNSRKLLPGDIIIEKSGGSDKQPVGRPVLFDISEGEYSFSNFTSTLRINNADEIIPQFLYCALYSAYLRGETFKLQSKTTGIHNLDFKGYNRLPIPIPSLSEQQSVVAELDKINELISLKKAQLSDLDRLTQSIFYDMFGDPVENEKEWEVKTFGELGTIERGAGISKKDFVDEGLPCIHYGQLHTILGPTTKHHYASIPKSLLPKYKIAHTGDLIMAITSEDVEGSCKSTAWLGDYDIVIGSDAAILHHEQNGTFLSYYTMTKAFFNEKAKYAKGFKVTHISTKEIESIPVYLPPLSLQQEFANRIEAIEQQKQYINSTINELETLLASRMQYWFD